MGIDFVAIGKNGIEHIPDSWGGFEELLDPWYNFIDSTSNTWNNLNSAATNTFDNAVSKQAVNIFGGATTGILVALGLGYVAYKSGILGKAIRLLK